MRQKTGFPPPYLVTSAPDRAEKARQDRVARNAIAIIEECRADLIGTGHAWVAQILDIALLQLSMNLNNVSHDELKLLTEALHDGAARSTGHEEIAPERA